MSNNCIKRGQFHCHPDQPHASEPSEPGKFNLTIEVEVYEIDISGGCEVYPPDIKYFAMFGGHEVEVSDIKGQWSGPFKEPV